MRLKLQENPREWQKFTAVMMLLPVLAGALLWRKGVLTLPMWLGLVTGALCVCLFSVLRPQAFRGFYRAGMTVSHHVGKLMGTVLLALVFLLVVTPLGLLLRALGKDLLQLRRPRPTDSYWTQARPPGELERMF
ncbi:MAG TPA: hypothetical protein VNO52_05210 [Methylomirabilota bacterium]|nr:hypothetical protein [Methylomirabilota bacterium]